MIPVLCPTCEGEGLVEALVAGHSASLEPVYRRRVCPTCLGNLMVEARCVECFGADAEIVCPDGRHRCEACARDVAASAHVVLDIICPSPVGQRAQDVARAIGLSPAALAEMLRLQQEMVKNWPGNDS